MIKEIGNVKLDYSFFSEKKTDRVSSVEEEILECVKNEPNVLTILQNDQRWQVLYHLSPVRQNILEWYDFDGNAECLEIGSECGAITEVLSRKMRYVDCVDPSDLRCQINAYRNKDLSNINIFVSDFQSLNLDKKYEYITLIGVLDRLDDYFNDDFSYTDLLIKLKSMLKPNGKLLIAVENKYGLNNWSGHADDKTGRYFASIIGANKTSENSMSFTKEKLNSLLLESGFSNCRYYYPIPDYKFPTQIFSDDNLPKSSDIVFENVTYDNIALKLFDENDAMKELIADGMFPVFANSFFVESGV